MAVRDRAHAADALCDVERIGWLPADKDGLKTAVQAAGHPSVFDDATVDFNLDAQVTLNTGNGVDSYSCHYLSPPFFFAS